MQQHHDYIGSTNSLMHIEQCNCLHYGPSNKTVVYIPIKKQEEHNNNTTEALKPYPDMMRVHFYNDIGNRKYLHDVAKNHVNTKYTFNRTIYKKLNKRTT